MKISIWNFFIILAIAIQVGHAPVFAESVDYNKKYSEALEAYRANNYSKVKEILEPIAKNKITASTQSDGNSVFLGPAILDLLGWTYADGEKYDKALEVFIRMQRVYPKEVFRGRLEGEGYYGGPGGAVALRNQILIYAAPHWLFRDSELKADCTATIKAAQELIKGYPDTLAPCWESCGTFSEFAVTSSGECLSKASAKEFDSRIGGLLGLVSPEEKSLIARTKMQIASKYREDRDYSSATRIYREVAQKYLRVYYVNEEDGIDEFFGLESIAAILQMQLDQKATPSDIKKTKDELRDACESLMKTIVRDPGEMKNILNAKCSLLLGTSSSGG